MGLVLNRTGGSFCRQLSLLQAFRNWKVAQNGNREKKWIETNRQMASLWIAGVYCDLSNIVSEAFLCVLCYLLYILSAYNLLKKFIRLVKLYQFKTVSIIKTLRLAMF